MLQKQKNFFFLSESEIEQQVKVSPTILGQTELKKKLASKSKRYSSGGSLVSTNRSQHSRSSADRQWAHPMQGGAEYRAKHSLAAAESTASSLVWSKRTVKFLRSTAS